MLEVVSNTGGIVPANRGIEPLAIEAVVVNQYDPEILENLTVATPIHVGRVGAVAFGIMVRRPDFTRPGYIGSDRVSGIGRPWKELTTDEQLSTGLGGASDEERARFCGTQTGFMIVRQTLLPSELSNVLRKDRFIGPAVIDKCAREVFETPDDLGEDYDHELSSLFGDTYDEDGTYSQIQRLTSLVIQSLGNDQLPQDSRLEVGRSYASWHGYPYYHSVIARISGACKTTVENFDDLADHFNIQTPRFALKA